MGPYGKTIATTMGGAITTILILVLQEIFPESQLYRKAEFMGAVGMVIGGILVWCIPNTKTDPAGGSVNVQDLPVKPGDAARLKSILAAFMIGFASLSLSACGTALDPTRPPEGVVRTQQEQDRVNLLAQEKVVKEATDEVTFLLQAKTITVAEAEQMHGLVILAGQHLDVARQRIDENKPASSSLDSAQAVLRTLAIQRANARAKK
jgi:hypothetical protein